MAKELTPKRQPIHATRRVKTYIASFRIIAPHPFDEIGKPGEILRLSIFGEYCPENSLRGYQLHDLLMSPACYQPYEIYVKGELITFPDGIAPPITAASMEKIQFVQYLMQHEHMSYTDALECNRMKEQYINKIKVSGHNS